MKRGAILLFRFSAKVSLLLCLSCVAIWIGSYRWQCGIDYGTRNSDLEILVTRGEFVVDWRTDDRGRGDERPMGLSWDWSRESGVDVLRAVTVIFPNEEPPVAGFFFSRTRCEDGGMTLALIPAAAIVGALGASAAGAAGWLRSRDSRTHSVVPLRPGGRLRPVRSAFATSSRRRRSVSLET